MNRMYVSAPLRGKGNVGDCDARRKLTDVYSQLTRVKAGRRREAGQVDRIRQATYLETTCSRRFVKVEEVELKSALD
jgi:hypothetical protein